MSALAIRGAVGTTNWILAAERLSPLDWRVLTKVVVTSSPYTFVDEEATPMQRYYQVATGPQAPVIMPIDASRWAWIPPGHFTMGSAANEKDRESKEGPQTTVTLTKGIWMGKYEVTQREYLTVMGTNPTHFTGDLERPVESVSWRDATNYCAKLTQLESRAGRLAAGYAYRLPTEAEWEYACRSGTTTRFSYSDDLSYAQLPDYAWYFGNGDNWTHTVGGKKPNAWGLYDMHGNVTEWCWDWYQSVLPGGNVTDPKGLDWGNSRVVRGGGFWSPANWCRSAQRSGLLPEERKYWDLGFRVVLAPVL